MTKEQISHEAMTLVASKGDPITAQEALDAWDAGKKIDVCEMSGFDGVGGRMYEQVIHNTAFEIIRYMLKHPFHFDAPDPEHARWKAYVKTLETVVFASGEVDKGMTGLQWGAALSEATVIMQKGYWEAMDSIPIGRSLRMKKQTPDPTLYQAFFKNSVAMKG